MSLPAKVRPIKAAPQDLYHGVPVLALRAGEPIPTPRAPERYAVRVYPDLARHLLTFNHDHNRSLRRRSVERFVSDMRAGLWWFTPEAVVFSQTGVLQNGQHRLMAVTEYGSDVWMMFDFGWPAEIINAIDRGTARTNSDAFRISDVSHGTIISAAITLVHRYWLVVGKTSSFIGLSTPSAQQALATLNEAPESWAAAARAGTRVYALLDKGLAPATWTALHHIIGGAYPDEVDAFFDAIGQGTDPAGSPTRVLGDWFRRRPLSATRTGDAREPVEVVIRGFNAWRSGKALSMPKTPGFVLSRVK